MKRMIAMLSVASAVVLMTAGVLAQAKPNFAGTWTMDQPAAPAAPPAGAPAGGGGGGRGGGRGGGGGWGNDFTITQDATTLTIDGMAAGMPQKYVFKLDGSESKNSVMGRGGAPADQVSKAVWAGDKLTITTTATGPNGPTETKRVVSLAAGKLSIETTAPGRDGGPGMPMTVTYSKK